MKIRIIRFNDYLGGRENRPNNGARAWSAYFERALNQTQVPFSVRDVEISSSVYKSLNSLKQSVQIALSLGEFPIVISDNHTSAIGTINGALEFYKQDLGVVWMDAHTDIHSPFTSHSGNLHGMPVAALLQYDHESLSRQLLSPDQIQLWNSLKSLQNHEAEFQSKDFIYVGIRDSEPEEQVVLKTHNIASIPAQACRGMTPEMAIEIIKSQFVDRKKIFVSFDLDSLDPLHALGVSVPADKGLELNWAQAVLDSLIQDSRVIGIELTEYNPTHDESHITAETCQSLNQLILNSLIIRSSSQRDRKSLSGYKIS